MSQVKSVLGGCFFFFFKQKTAYEMVRSDWSSDVCSSDLAARKAQLHIGRDAGIGAGADDMLAVVGKRSEERRVGKECFVPCRSRGWAHHEKKKSCAHAPPPHRSCGHSARNRGW